MIVAWFVKRSKSFSCLWVTFCLLHFVKGEICSPSNNIFHVKVNVHAAAAGYFQFEECGDDVNPTLGLELGEVYTFIQEDGSNYFHPLAFAYFPDGFHDGWEVLQPSRTTRHSTNGDCERDNTCVSPMYFIDEIYLGSYSNIPWIQELSRFESDNGVEHYEPLFYGPALTWQEAGTFSVKLRFDDETYPLDIFYFSRKQPGMSGRIKFLRNGLIVETRDIPQMLYDYQEGPTGFDQECGTTNTMHNANNESSSLVDFQLPNPNCPERFVCQDYQAPRPEPFSTCVEAINCQMLAQQTTGSSANSESILFLHQMIPHQQSAIHMTKSYLKLGKDERGSCPDHNNPLCLLELLSYEILQQQYAQLQVMRDLIETLGSQETDECYVKIHASSVISDDYFDDYDDYFYGQDDDRWPIARNNGNRRLRRATGDSYS